MKSCPHPLISEPLAPPQREEQARSLCLRLLTARARTRAELADQLAKRGYPDEVSIRVLDRLAGAGLVDDADFAQQWVRSRSERSGKSRKALLAELRAKGVDDEVIAEALDGMGVDSERDRAKHLVQAKLRRESLGDDDAKVVRRLVALLARRGYGPSMSYEVVSTELAAERERRRV